MTNRLERRREVIFSPIPNWNQSSLILDHPICHNSGCKCGWCSRRGLWPQPNRDLSLRHQAGKILARTGLLLKFCDKSYQLPLILPGASPKPGPWVHHRAQGGDIWTRQNAFLGNYDTDIDRGATSSASFVLEEVVSLIYSQLKGVPAEVHSSCSSAKASSDQVVSGRHTFGELISFSICLTVFYLTQVRL